MGLCKNSRTILAWLFLIWPCTKHFQLLWVHRRFGAGAVPGWYPLGNLREKIVIFTCSPFTPGGISGYLCKHERLQLLPFPQHCGTCTFFCTGLTEKKRRAVSSIYNLGSHVTSSTCPYMVGRADDVTIKLGTRNKSR
ncbi:hypothetical protein SRHO_G00118670, partial [Serrasalmus rhombeus]